MNESRVVDDIIKEREKQIARYNDDSKWGGDLTKAALNYVAAACSVQAVQAARLNDDQPPPFSRDGRWLGTVYEWPLSREAWKPDNSRCMLIKAAALLIAEIERGDRNGSYPRYNAAE